VIHAEPFQPYRLVLSDGEEVLVRRARKSHVSGDQIALVGECRRPGGAAVERFRLIDVGRVITAEAVDVKTRR
jgi:hypothetical protein